MTALLPITKITIRMPNLSAKTIFSSQNMEFMAPKNSEYALNSTSTVKETEIDS